MRYAKPGRGWDYFEYNDKYYVVCGDLPKNEPRELEEGEVYIRDMVSLKVEIVKKTDLEREATLKHRFKHGDSGRFHPLGQDLCEQNSASYTFYERLGRGEILTACISGTQYNDYEQSSVDERFQVRSETDELWWIHSGILIPYGIPDKELIWPDIIDRITEYHSSLSSSPDEDEEDDD